MRTYFVLFFAIVLMGSSAPLFGQEWSAEQKEVWKTVETYSELFAKRDLEKAYVYFHDDFLGWMPENPYPDDAASRKKWASEFFSTTKTIVYDLKPLGIQIFDDVAVVHYYYNEVVKNAEGREIASIVRWTDILRKQGDKWLLISDHGTPVP